MVLEIFGVGKKNRARNKRYERALELWEEQRDEKRAQYRYQKDALKITKRNTYANLDAQDQNRLQSYNYEVARQRFEHDAERKVYERSVQEATQGFQFADLAEQQANLQQDRYLFENELALDLDEQQTALNYRFAAAGLAVHKRKAKTAAAGDLQKTAIDSLKAAGQAAARGQAGRNAYKNQQAILAESAAIENQIVENLFNENLSIDLDLRKLSDQLIFDKTSLELSRQSLKASDAVQRMAFKRDKLQAYMDAARRVEMFPEMGPPIPKPFTLPRPEFQKVYKPNFKIGKPKIDDFGEKASFGDALLADALKIGGAVLTGVTAGASAGATGLSAAAGSSGIFGMSQTTAAGVGAGLGSFLSQ
tara:strand:+ start:52 stop:1140 length:1089 start_codon:yes stop_codon:yes gene_type:complete